MINRDTIINDILANHPNTEEVFNKFGIQCFGWGGLLYKSVGYAVRRHGIDANKLIEEIQKKVH